MLYVYLGLIWSCMQSIKTLEEKLLLLEYGIKLAVQIPFFQRFAIFLEIRILGLFMHDFNL